jgi:acetyl-CoA acetyltransferase
MDTPETALCTPVGRFGGTLASVPATELGRQAVAAVPERSALAPERVDAAIMGNVIQAGAGMNPARQAALKGGLRKEAPAMTVDRVCDSGAQAIASAAMEVALDRAGWARADLERVEINEAFAAVAIAVLPDLDLPEDIVNVEGGAIAHGHPIDATGAILTVRLLHSMRRGLVTQCIGGGQGIALAPERPD